MKIELDRARCEGHGVCEEVAPEMYRLDDAGDLELLHDTVPTSMEAKAQSGARLCPVAALKVIP